MTSSGLSQLFSWIAIGCSLRQNGFGLAFAAHIPDSPALAEFNFSIMVFSFAAGELKTGARAPVFAELLPRNAVLDIKMIGEREGTH